MSINCPHCGALSKEPDWCDVCGGDLREVQEGAQPWLEVGDALPVRLSSAGPAQWARVVEQLESYNTRRVLLARLCPEGLEAEHFTPRERGEAQEGEAPSPPPCPTSWPLLLLEESEEDHSMEPDVLTDDVRELVQRPLEVQPRGAGRSLEVYHAPPGKPLQEFLESLNRLLTLEEAVTLTHLLLDAIERIHNAGLYHFQICPWTIRVSAADEAQGGVLTLERPREELRLHFEGIRGFYDAAQPLESHPVILGFSPPEFFRRSMGPLDHRVDIFGAGMLFYYLVAGTPPPTGALTRHRPYLPVRAFRFHLMPGLQPFVDGCTALSPTERFASIAQARAALGACQELERARRIQDPEEQRPISLFCAVDRHIGIGKGRRTPVNQDAVFLGHAPHRHTSIIAVADGVSTASFGSGDVASRLLVEATAEVWRDLLRNPTLLKRTQRELPHPEDGPHTVDEVPHRHAAQASPEPLTDPEIPSALIAQAMAPRPPEASPDAQPGDAPEAPLADADAQTADAPAAPEHDGDAPEVLLESIEEELRQLDREYPDEDEGDEDEDEDEEITQGRLSLVGHRTGPVEMETPAAWLLRRALETSNDAISAYINARFSPFDGPVHEVMGTTAVLACIHHDVVTLASLGDSRAYLLRNGHMECLTRDHNLATMRILEGYPADESLSLPQGMALARCLGTFEIRKGQLQAVHPEPDLMSFRLLPGDVLLLTTDGLIDFAGPTEAAAERNIKGVLEAEEVPALACLRLMLMANEGGGEDNIGVAIVRVTERQPGQRPMIYQSFPPVKGMSPGE
jgi:serine/threonine protein phosphatase PrpC